jgi:hypothetical protein
LTLAAAVAGAQASAQDIGSQPLPPPNGPDVGQIESQARGDYPTLSNPAHNVGGAFQEIWNNASPEAGILHVKEPVGKTIKVIIREAMPLTITLPAGQKILDFSIGDQEAFGAQRCPSDEGCLWVWSKHPGFDSLISIVTQDRSVQFQKPAPYLAAARLYRSGF